MSGKAVVAALILVVLALLGANAVGFASAASSAGDFLVDTVGRIGGLAIAVAGVLVVIAVIPAWLGFRLRRFGRSRNTELNRAEYLLVPMLGWNAAIVVLLHVLAGGLGDLLSGGGWIGEQLRAGEPEVASKPTLDAGAKRTAATPAADASAAPPAPAGDGGATLDAGAVGDASTVRADAAPLEPGYDDRAGVERCRFDGPPMRVTGGGELPIAASPEAVYVQYEKTVRRYVPADKDACELTLDTSWADSGILTFEGRVAIAVDELDRLYVAVDHSDRGEVRRYDRGRKRVECKVPKGARRIAVSPDGAFSYVYTGSTWALLHRVDIEPKSCRVSATKEEFHADNMAIIGDQLAAVISNSRVTVYSPDGKVLREFERSSPKQDPNATVRNIRQSQAIYECPTGVCVLSQPSAIIEYLAAGTVNRVVLLQDPRVTASTVYWTGADIGPESVLYLSSIAKLDGESLKTAHLYRMKL